MKYRAAFDETMLHIYCDNHREEISYEEAIEQVVHIFETIKANHGIAYFIGNGGSAAISMHMTTDFLKNGRIKTHSMHDPAMLTCLGNDYGYEYVFSKHLELVAEPGDILVAISSSGNSPNIINAVHIAKKKSCHIVTLSGFKPDNALRQLGDINIYVPSMEYGIVESIHNMILQQVVDEIMAKDKEDAKE